MKKRYLSLLLCGLISFHLSANQVKDSLYQVAHSAWSYTNPLTQFAVQQSLNNPALRYYLPRPAVSRIQLRGERTKKHQPIAEQLSDRSRFFTLEAKSAIPLQSNTFVWGGASYRRGKEEAIRFNNTSDFDLVYPYVMADDLGGFIQSETYQFQGGYLHHFARPYTVGVEVSYRALMAYRDKDPRPKNTVSDLELRLGGSRELGSNYHLGVAGSIQKYKQDNSIKFVSELNVRPIYHLSGLGMRAARFDGTAWNTQYDGWGYTGAVAFNHNQHQGWLGELAYRYFDYDKQLSELRNATLQRLTDQQFTGSLGRQGRNWAIDATVFWQKREGTEYLFGTPEGGHYPVLGHEKPYLHQRHQLSLRGLLHHTYGPLQLYLSPQVSYHSDKESYQEPQRYLKQTNLNAKFAATARYTHTSAGVFTVDASARQSWNLQASHLLTGLTPDHQLYPLLSPLVERLGKKETAGRASMRWDLPFQLIRSTELYIEGAWTGCFIADYKPIHHAQLSLGFLF